MTSADTIIADTNAIKDKLRHLLGHERELHTFGQRNQAAAVREEIDTLRMRWADMIGYYPQQDPFWAECAPSLIETGRLSYSVRDGVPGPRALGDDRQLALEVARTATDLAESAGADQIAVADLRRVVQKLETFDLTDVDPPEPLIGHGAGPAPMRRINRRGYCKS